MPVDEGPSRESLREVKREFKQRRKDDKARAKAAQSYWDEQSGRGRRRSWIAPVAGITGLVVLAGAGLYALKAGPFAATPSAAAARPSSPASPTAPAKASPSSSLDGTDPTVKPAFWNSPARNWPTGAAGITTPKPKQVGVYRPAQVADAYAQTRAYLRVVLLDPHVLYRGQLSSVWSAMDSSSVSWIKAQHATFVKTKGKQGYGYAQVAVRFHPGDWRAAAETRVRGKVSPRIDKKDGALVVDFTYVAAYWLAPSKGGTARPIAVRVEGQTAFFGNGAQHVTRLQTGFLGIASSAGVCNSKWKYPDYLEAWYDPRSAPVTSEAVSGGGFDMSDPNATPPPGTCYTNTSGFG